jgi:hypothetical protein
VLQSAIWAVLLASFLTLWRHEIGDAIGRIRSVEAAGVKIELPAEDYEPAADLQIDYVPL